MNNENSKKVSVGMGYFSGYFAICLLKGFLYGIGIMFAMKMFGVEL